MIRTSTKWAVFGLTLISFCSLAAGALVEDYELVYEQSSFQEPTGRYWYAPSRKAHLHSRRYQNMKTSSMKQGEDMRLPGDIIPVSYNVRLVPFIGGNFTTDGFVEILVKCLQGTYNVSLNSADIDIDISSVSVI